jgi:hypothetical protein
MSNKREAILNKVHYLGLQELVRRVKAGVPVNSNPADPVVVSQRIALSINPEETATPKQIAALKSAHEKLWAKSTPLIVQSDGRSFKKRSW